MDNSYGELLEYVRDRRAIDFNVYRPETIDRRLKLRLSATEMPDYASYLRYVNNTPSEIDNLVDSLTIKVSHFFRNPFTFETLRELVLPDILETFRNDTLRIWCAGCAQGEEVYSLAILMKEIIGNAATPPRIFLIGTDIDTRTLEEAKKGVYKADSLLEAKKGYLDKYFDIIDGFYHLKGEITSFV